MVRQHQRNRSHRYHQWFHSVLLVFKLSALDDCAIFIDQSHTSLIAKDVGKGRNSHRTRLICALLLTLVIKTEGHGRLKLPPGRGSMWRYGYDVAKDYNDNQLFCGGFGVHHGTNRGKCGICGDPYGQPAEHEAGGKYAPGIIVAMYQQGQIADIEVELTANHKGWFEFRVCVHNDFSTPATHDCLNENILKFEDGTTRYPINPGIGIMKFKVIIPEVTCTQCVLQWKYKTGNSWGTGLDGRGCLGCGIQEEFYGCADIAISESGVLPIISPSTSQTTSQITSQTTSQITSPTTSQTTSPTTSLTTSPTTSQTTSPVTSQTTSQVTSPTTSQATSPTTSLTTSPTTSQTTSPVTSQTTSQVTSPTTSQATSPTTSQTTSPTTNQMSDTMRCVAFGPWLGIAGKDEWCETNCRIGFCPENCCTCMDMAETCRAIGIFVGSDFDNWCINNCLLGNCPADRCECYELIIN